MGLREELVLINNKPYQPVFSGKLNTPYEKKFEREKVRPQTCPKLTNTSTSNTQFTSRATTATFFRKASQQNQKNSQLSVSKNDFLKQQHNYETPSDEFDRESLNETNISLLSLESNKTVPELRSYGKFQYLSYFERYMNRRAIVKIPINFMPKMPESQETILEPTIYELLHKDELNKLFNLFNVEKAMPFRIRSISVASEMPTKRHDLKMVQKKITNENLMRRNSLACVKLEYIQKNFKFANKTTSNEEKYNENSNKDTNDTEWKLRLKNDEEERTPSPTFTMQEIESPKIYVMGDAAFKRRLEKTLNSKASKKGNGLNYYDIDKDINNLDHLKKPYNYVDSKLAAYLKPQNKTPTGNANLSFTNTKISKTAISTHKMSSAPFVFYRTLDSVQPMQTKRQKINSADCLKLSKSLDTKIREDLRINRGPVFFGQLNQENLDILNDFKSFKLSDRFLYLYEWLEKLDEKECSHFYSNPFKTDQSLNTEPEKNIESGLINDLYVPFNKNAKIDPFANPKLKLTNNRIIRNINPDVQSKEKYYETQDNQTLAVIKDYKSYLHLNHHNPNNIKYKSLTTLKTSKLSRTQPIELENILTNREVTKDKLKKQINLNEITLTRMKLDLFVL